MQAERISILNGVYQARLVSAKARQKLELHQNGQKIGDCEVAKNTKGDVMCRVALPTLPMDESRHIFTIVDTESASVVDMFSYGLEGATATDEVAQIREELDLLKKAFRREMRARKQS